MKNRKFRRGKAFLILLLIFTMFLTGCRESPVLEQIVYKQNNETDPDYDALENDENNDIPNEELTAKEQVDDSKQKDTERTDALSGDENDQADTTYDLTYDDTADANGNSSTSAGDSSDPDGDGNSTDTNGSDVTDKPGNIPNDNVDPNKPGTGSDPGGGNVTDPDQPGNPSDPSADPTPKMVTDARGQHVDIPENVDCVTAVGEAAPVVFMLGGSGRLLGSSASFTGNSMAQSVFASQGISEVNTWWGADGSGTIDEESFNALLAAKPEVCFEISGQNTFSSEQVAKMSEAEITYVVLYPFDTLEHIKENVRIAGDILGDKSSEGGTNAPQIARRYSDWVDNLIGQVKKKNSSEKRTLYVGWDDTVTWEVYNTDIGVSDLYMSGTGVMTANLYLDKQSPLDELLGTANILNHITVRRSGLPKKADILYLDALWSGWHVYYDETVGVHNLPVYFFRDDVNSPTCYFGDKQFPAIIADSLYTAEKIAGDIRYQVYNYINGNVTGTNSGTGFVMKTLNATQLASSYISDNYEIYVNPYGVGSWADGSVESPLEAAWVSWKFGDGISEGEFESLVSDFYSTFYHYEIDVDDLLEDDIYIEKVNR